MNKCNTDEVKHRCLPLSLHCLFLRARPSPTRRFARRFSDLAETSGGCLHVTARFGAKSVEKASLKFKPHLKTGQLSLSTKTNHDAKILEHTAAFPTSSLQHGNANSDAPTGQHLRLEAHVDSTRTFQTTDRAHSTLQGLFDASSAQIFHQSGLLNTCRMLHRVLPDLSTFTSLVLESNQHDWHASAAALLAMPCRLHRPGGEHAHRRFDDKLCRRYSGTICYQ